MKNKLKKGVMGTAIAMAMAGNSLMAETMDVVNVCPYLGLDYYHAYMKPKNSWAQIFPKSYPGLTFYVGTKFHENFGLELGYDWSIEQSKKWTLATGQRFFNSTVRGTFSGTT